MDRNALAELLQALESRRDAEERRREERYTALIERAFQGNQTALKSTFQVSLRNAKEKKPHTIEEDLIKPCVKDICKSLLGEEAAKKVDLIPLSNDTVLPGMMALCTNARRTGPVSENGTGSVRHQYQNKQDKEGDCSQ
ncbi:UNVERIFIED_CONTAM: hypothetical protein FKN15_041891 [Acipenser sinensis]